MKQAWSPKWKSSIQPRKQRKFRVNAPLHVRHKFVSANLSPALRNEFGRRSMPLRKGDGVEVMRGSFRKFKGVVERVDLRKGKIFVEGVKIKKVDGSEVLRVLEPSNLRITKMGLDDKMRQKVLERSPKKEKPRKEKKPENGKGKPVEKKEEKETKKKREHGKPPEKIREKKGKKKKVK